MSVNCKHISALTIQSSFVVPCGAHIQMVAGSRTGIDCSLEEVTGASFCSSNDLRQMSLKSMELL